MFYILIVFLMNIYKVNVNRKRSAELRWAVKDYIL